jgi:zinc finger protein 830
MTDVRALLAAERQSRRITHPHLTYTKSGALMCTICNLNVKSESLWEGHLRSANHRKNVAGQASRQASAETGKGTKRKIEDVEETNEDEGDGEEMRKKPKSRPESMATVAATEDLETGPTLPNQAATNVDSLDASAEATMAPVPVSDASVPPVPAVDEDEWAAFEAEVASLKQAKPTPGYSSVTITAAPVTTDQLQAQEDEDRRRRLDTEAEDEKEEEAERLAEEFDVMEEMEERVRRLREKRDALRLAPKTVDDTGQEQPVAAESATVASEGVTEARQEEAESEDDEDEEVDDWYS